MPILSPKVNSKARKFREKEGHFIKCVLTDQENIKNLNLYSAIKNYEFNRTTDKSTIMLEDFNPHLSVIESIYSLRVYMEHIQKIDYMLDHNASFNKIVMTEDTENNL